MDRMAEIMDGLGSYDPCHSTDCGNMVLFSATALVEHRLWRQVSRRFCDRLDVSMVYGIISTVKILSVL